MTAAPLLPDLAMTLVFVVMAMGMLLSAGGLLTWVERKQSAVMSDRVGANRAYIRLPFTQVRIVWLGLFHGMADGLKLLLKENFTPGRTTSSGTGWPRSWRSRRCCWCSAWSPSAGCSTRGRWCRRSPRGSAGAPTPCRWRRSTPGCWWCSP